MYSFPNLEPVCWYKSFIQNFRKCVYIYAYLYFLQSFSNFKDKVVLCGSLNFPTQPKCYINIYLKLIFSIYAPKGLLFIGNASTVSLQYNIFNEMFQTLQAHVKILLNCHQIFLVEFTRECTMYLRLEHLYLAVGSIEMHDLS